MLTTLDLKGDPYGSTNCIGPEGASAIAEALKVNEVLTSLNLSDNALCGVKYGRGSYDASGIQALAEALKVNAVLKTLNVRRNNIGEEGATAIGEALRGNEVLNNLDVRSNDISGDAAQQLATAVLASSTLELFGSVPLKELRANTLDQLDLSGDSLGVPEALVLAKLVEGSGVLKTLSIGGNEIGVQGAAAIASALRVNEVLTELNLGSNQLCGIDYFGRGTYSAAGITALAEALKVNGAVLTDLNLFNNNIRDEGAAAIAEALRGNEVLKYLDIRGNGLGAAGEGVIRAAVSGRCHGFELLLKM